MSRRAAAFAAILLPLVTCPLAGQTPLPVGEAPRAADAGVLVMRSGQVFRGQVTPLGQRYLVRLGPGNEVRIAAADVAYHCATILEVYHRKREDLPPGNVNARLDLVEWCLRQQLWPQAAEQLTIAMRLEPENRRVADLERRLVSSTRPAAPPADQPSRPVVPASLEELERAQRELPTGSVERFTSTVQPLLLNRCGTNSCHGPGGSSTYHLLRPGQGNSASRRFTLRNLHATLAWVDREDPESSVLLERARQPHGSEKRPVSGANEQGQYEPLVHWVREVARPKTNIAPATLSGSQNPPPHATRWAGPIPLAESGALAGPQSTGGHSKGASAEPEKLTVPSESGEPRGVRATTPPGIPAGRDPFDPEIFNRRYSGKTPAPPVADGEGDTST